MKGHGSKFGRKKAAAIVALVNEPTIDAAARVIGVSGKTLRRWLQIPEFQEEYQKALREVHRQCMARIQQNSPAAVTVMLRMMADPAVPPAIRLKAAYGIYDRSADGSELQEIRERILALELAYKKKKD
jgi:hypothetical protein